MRIAICDDENIWINHIEEYIKKIKSIYNEIEYDVFISGESLLSHYNNEDSYFRHRNEWYVGNRYI